jgi:hypothetical protein
VRAATPEDARRPSTARSPANAAAPGTLRPELGFGAMQREMQGLRQLLETARRHDVERQALREPLQARVLEELSAMDIAPDVARTLAALAPRRTTLTNPSHIPLALLVKHLPVVDNLEPP